MSNHNLDVVDYIKMAREHGGVEEEIIDEIAARLSNEQDVRALLSSINSNLEYDSFIQYMVQAVRQAANPRIISALVTALSSDQTYQAEFAAIALGEIKALDSADALIHALKNPRPEVRVRATGLLA